MKRVQRVSRWLIILLALLFWNQSSPAKVGARLVLINPNLQMVRIGDRSSGIPTATD